MNLVRLSLEPGLPSFENLFGGASVQALCLKPHHRFLSPLSGSGASPGVEWGVEAVDTHLL